MACALFQLFEATFQIFTFNFHVTYMSELIQCFFLEEDVDDENRYGKLSTESHTSEADDIIKQNSHLLG